MAFLGISCEWREQLSGLLNCKDGKDVPLSDHDEVRVADDSWI